MASRDVFIGLEGERGGQSSCVLSGCIDLGYWDAKVLSGAVLCLWEGVYERSNRMWGVPRFQRCREPTYACVRRASRICRGRSQTPFAKNSRVSMPSRPKAREDGGATQ